MSQSILCRLVFKLFFTHDSCSLYRKDCNRSKDQRSTLVRGHLLFAQMCMYAYAYGAKRVTSIQIARNSRERKNENEKRRKRKIQMISLIALPPFEYDNMIIRL